MQGSRRIALLMAVGATGAAAGSAQAVAPDAKPTIRSIHVSNKVFAVSKQLTQLTIAGPRVKLGTKLRVTLDMPAQIVVLVQRRDHGRVNTHGVCVPLKHHNRHRPVCNVLKTRMTLTRVGHKGRNGIPFTGRAPGVVLRPGAYQFAVHALNGTKQSAERTAFFRIVRG